jgi:HK97 family phage prohead protease
MSPAALMVERHRRTLTEYRADTADGSRFRARVMSYDRLDDYRTHFAPGQWTVQLESGDLPPLLYGHNWQSLAEVLGRAIDFTDTRASLDLLYRLDVDANPWARQAAAQLKSATLREFSVGFTRTADEPSEMFPGATRITASYLDETSIVPRGSVPDTAVLSMPRAAYYERRSKLLAGAYRGGRRVKVNPPPSPELAALAEADEVLESLDERGLLRTRRPSLPASWRGRDL